MTDWHRAGTFVRDYPGPWCAAGRRARGMNNGLMLLKRSGFSVHQSILNFSVMISR